MHPTNKKPNSHLPITTNFYLSMSTRCLESHSRLMTRHPSEMGGLFTIWKSQRTEYLITLSLVSYHNNKRRVSQCQKLWRWDHKLCRGRDPNLQINYHQSMIFPQLMNHPFSTMTQPLRSPSLSGMIHHSSLSSRNMEIQSSRRWFIKKLWGLIHSQSGWQPGILLGSNWLQGIWR